MNKDIMKQAGFTKEVERVEGGKCPFCGKPIDIRDFRTPLDTKEYTISGLCQPCQDSIFNVEVEGDEWDSIEEPF